ncbi:DUF262 domain-containing protein [Vibrio vulnificus]|nr:DUF262 domain-containing protein [Vibrio vulnificus]
MNELLESIPSTNVKIIELYNKIDSKSLILSPDFQRKLVWKKQHKYHFIETILLNYPFPEVYIASAEMDVDNIKASEVVVDGQQRLSTIVDYIKSDGDFKNQNRVRKFDELTTPEKKNFLNYFVSVRDLKNLEPDIIKNIFMRINNTEYSLNAIEKVNAQYGDGEFIIFCKQLVDRDFEVSESSTDAIVSQGVRDKFISLLEKTNVFSENDMKRMIDLQLMMTIVATLIESEYFSRNSKVQAYIESYNNSFERKSAIENALEHSMDAFLSLDLPKNSYWYSKSNFFTLIIELSKIKSEDYDFVKLSSLLNALDEKSKKYFAGIEVDQILPEESKYFEYAKEAVNEKNARIHRGHHVSQLILSCQKGA